MHNICKYVELYHVPLVACVSYSKARMVFLGGHPAKY